MTSSRRTLKQNRRKPRDFRRRGFASPLGAFSLATVVAGDRAHFVGWGTASGHDFGFHAAPRGLDRCGAVERRDFFSRDGRKWANLRVLASRDLFFYSAAVVDAWGAGAGLCISLECRAGNFSSLIAARTMAGLCSFAAGHGDYLPVGAGAALAAACYAANPYALLIVYMRSDFAELLACRS